MDIQWLFYLPLIIALHIITKHFLHKLRNLPPTPFLNLPILGHLYLLKKPLHHTLAKISDHYGPVILLQFGSRRVLVVSSPSAAEECFTKNDIIFANRPHLLIGKHFGYNYNSLVWSPYGDHWRNLRKISSIEILSNHKLQLLHEIRADEVKSLIRKLNRASGSGELLDMKRELSEFTMNVVMRMIAGKRYYGENMEEVEEAEMFREIRIKSMRIDSVSNMEDCLPLLRWLGVGREEKRMVELHKKRDAFVKELVEGCKRRFTSYGEDGGVSEMAKHRTQTKTMIEMLLALQEKEPEYYTDECITSLTSVMLIAGSETSAGTMEWAISLLLNNPHVLKKAQIEIDNHVGHDRLIDESDIAELPYLRGIVNETLRMYPAAPLLVPHESSEQCTVGGYRVPAGTMLLVNAWAIQNDPKNWEDPTKFKPERFEGKMEETRNGFKLMPFGSGRRSCPGEGLAVRMVGYGLGSVIQCFDWDKVGEGLVDMTGEFGITLPRAEPLMAYCKTRPFVAKLLSQI